MKIHHFGPTMVYLAKEKPFLKKKIINIIFIYLLATVIVQNFWKILTVDLDLRGLFQTGIFSENLLTSLLHFIQAYLRTKIRVRYSSINEILIFINIQSSITKQEISVKKFSFSNVASSGLVALLTYFCSNY